MDTEPFREEYRKASSITGEINFNVADMEHVKSPLKASKQGDTITILPQHLAHHDESTNSRRGKQSSHRQFSEELETLAESNAIVGPVFQHTGPEPSKCSNNEAEDGPGRDPDSLLVCTLFFPKFREVPYRGQRNGTEEERNGGEEEVRVPWDGYFSSVFVVEVTAPCFPGLLVFQNAGGSDGIDAIEDWTAEGDVVTMLAWVCGWEVHVASSVYFFVLVRC